MTRVCGFLLLVISVIGVAERSQAQVQAWIADPHRRVYPGSFGRDLSKRDVRLEAARNEYAIFQLAAKSPSDARGVEAVASELAGHRGTIPATAVRVRYPGFLPVDENGQLTPDPLFVRPSIDLKANVAQPIWVDVKVPENAAAGEYNGKLTLRRAGTPIADFSVRLKVLDFTLPAVNRDHFYFNVLMDPGSVARLHKVPRWSDAHWSLLEKYVKNWAEHSQDAITVFFIEDPWEGDTGFPVASVVEWKLPGAWESLDNPKFEFDYSRFDRFVQMCLDAGIDKNLQAWSPVNMPHRDYAVIVYTDTKTNQTKRIKATAGSPDYERIWSQFAQSFEQHLKQKNWLDITTVGLDEISTENLDKIVPVFRKVAPNLKLMVSGGDEKGKYNEFSPEIAFHFGYINSEVPLPDTKARRAAGKRSLIYTANTPLRPNTFLFSEPLESRMLPWLISKYDFDGYIRWAWNFWFDGFWEQPFYKWHSGDMFFVYPGPDGPLDSIRSEMFRKGAQDYEVIWMIRQALAKRNDSELTRKIEERLKNAMELATQEADPVRPHRPLPAEMPEARAELNKILLELQRR